MTETQISTFRDPEKIVSTEEVAAYLGLAPITLAKMRTTGGGPRYLKLGRAVRYRMADVQQWALEQRHSHTAEYAQVI